MGDTDMDSPEETDEESDSGESSGKLDAAQAIMRAFKLGDAGALSKALGQHQDLHAMSSDGDDEAKEEAEGEEKKPHLSLAMLMAGKKK